MHVAFDQEQFPLIYLDTHLDEGYHRSLNRILRKIAPEYHEYIIGNITALLSQLQPHVIIDKTGVHLAIYDKGQSTSTFSLTQQGYIPSTAYVHPRKFITDSGGAIVGKEPSYYIPELDRGPHRIQTAIGLLEPHPHIQKNVMPRIGIFNGLELHGNVKQIKNDFLHPRSIEHIKAGLHHMLPNTIKPILRVHQLPEKKERASY